MSRSSQGAGDTLAPQASSGGASDHQQQQQQQHPQQRSGSGDGSGGDDGGSGAGASDGAARRAGSAGGKANPAIVSETLARAHAQEIDRQFGLRALTVAFAPPKAPKRRGAPKLGSSRPRAAATRGGGKKRGKRGKGHAGGPSAADPESAEARPQSRSSGAKSAGSGSSPTAGRARGGTRDADPFGTPGSAAHSSGGGRGPSSRGRNVTFGAAGDGTDSGGSGRRKKRGGERGPTPLGVSDGTPSGSGTESGSTDSDEDIVGLSREDSSRGLSYRKLSSSRGIRPSLSASNLLGSGKGGSSGQQPAALSDDDSDDGDDGSATAVDFLSGDPIVERKPRLVSETWVGLFGFWFLFLIFFCYIF
jgi:hypothetical protein